MWAFSERVPRRSWRRRSQPGGWVRLCPDPAAMDNVYAAIAEALGVAFPAATLLNCRKV